MTLSRRVLGQARQFVVRAPRLLSIPRQWVWCATQGVPWHPGWRLYGRPHFRQVSGGRIVIGQRFTARSENHGNSIGVFQPVILTAWGAGSLLEIGDDVRVSGCSVTACKHVVIGSRVLIGSGVLIIDSDAHSLHPKDRLKDTPPSAVPIEIADDVFIGARAIILKGVSIGEGAVIGAGAVVTASIPPFKIAAGNPARVVGVVRERGQPISGEKLLV